MTGRSITKGAKRRRSTTDVLPPAARTAARQVLESLHAGGLWVLLAELGVDGRAAMEGELNVDGVSHATYRYGTGSWVLNIDDVPNIMEWFNRRTRFIGHGSAEGSRELADWLRGPVSSEVRRRLSPAPYARHISIGVRVLNAIAKEDLVRLTKGSEPLLWELTGRVGVAAEEIEPHSTRRVHAILNQAAAELNRDCGER